MLSLSEARLYGAHLLPRDVVNINCNARVYRYVCATGASDAAITSAVNASPTKPSPECCNTVAAFNAPVKFHSVQNPMSLLDIP